MNKQLNKLLMILVNAPGQYFNYAELAAILAVSSRSVRNYIQNLTQFMGDIRLAEVLQISEGGVTFAGSSKDINRILDEVIDTEFYLYRLSPEERCTMIILYFLLLDDYSNLQELSEKFNVSRTTALKDMEKVKEGLVHYHLELDPAVKKGYRLRTGESRRRELILKLTRNSQGSLFAVDSQINLYKKFLFDEWELGQHTSWLKRILLEAEEQYGLEVSDVNFEEILLTLQIIVKRLSDGRQIAASEQGQNFRNKEVYQVAGDILKQLAAGIPADINEAEVEFLASRLHDCRFYRRTAVQEGRDVRLHLALTGFLLKISEQLKIAILDNHVTAEQLESHLRAIDKAHLEGRQIRNEYTEQMIGEYPQYFELICQYRGILENVLEYQYTRDDLAVLLIYLVVMMERLPNEGSLPEVIVVCHTGIGTANFLAKKLSNNFDIKILAITSNHKLNELIGRYDCDLIISTVSLEADPETWIKVSPVLTDEDILKLQKLFMDIRKRKRKASEQKAGSQHDTGSKVPKNTIAEVLCAEHILLDRDCFDWTRAIRSAAEPLYEEGVIENRYIEEMIRSVQVNGAYFVYSPGVALVHAGPTDGVNSFGLTLMRLASPVSFGHKQHDPVTYVICMAVKEKDYRLQVIMKLMDMLSRSEIIRALNQMTNAEQMLRYLNGEEGYEKHEF